MDPDVFSEGGFLALVGLDHLLFFLIQAPENAAPRGDKEEHETIEHGQLTVIDDGKKLGSGFDGMTEQMELEISHSHHAAGDKGGPTGLKADENQYPSN